MTTTEEVEEYLRGWKARDAEVKKLQRQKFLLETRLEEYREDRKKWLQGTDNAALRDKIANYKEEVNQKEIQRREFESKYDKELRKNQLLAERLESAENKVRGYEIHVTTIKKPENPKGPQPKSSIPTFKRWK